VASPQLFLLGSFLVIAQTICLPSSAFATDHFANSPTLANVRCSPVGCVNLTPESCRPAARLGRVASCTAQIQIPGVLVEIGAFVRLVERCFGIRGSSHSLRVRFLTRLISTKGTRFYRRHDEMSRRHCLTVTRRIKFGPVCQTEPGNDEGKANLRRSTLLALHIQ
jgi:hypothetical protein